MQVAAADDRPSETLANSSTTALCLLQSGISPNRLPYFQTASRPTAMKQIISPHNSQLKHLAKLGTSAKYRRECRQTVLEGTHLLDALLQTGTQPQQVYLAQSCLDKPEIQNLLSRIPPAHTTAVEDRLLAKASALADGGSILSLTGIRKPPPRRKAATA